MSRIGFLAGALLLIPILASADVGFARSALWLSQTDVAEGSTVTVYASLSNASEEKLNGAVTFFDDGTEIGKNAVTLAAGEGKIVSVSWSPKDPGTHTLKAAMLSDTGAALDELTVAVVVAKKPGQNEAAVIEGSEDIQKKIAELSPQAGEALNPVFTKIDDLRQTGAQFLDDQIAQAQTSLTDVSAKKDDLKKAKVMGTFTEEQKSEDRKLTASFFFQTLLLYTLSVIRFVVSNAALFYPLLAALFLVGIYKLFQRWRNPARYAGDI